MKRNCDTAPAVDAASAWKLKVDGALSGAENMAADEKLLEEQKSPDAVPVLRFFQWAAPTVSYGRIQDEQWVQSIAKSFQVGATAAFNPRKTEYVRRPTGGGMVWHHKDLSFSVSWRRDSRVFSGCLKDVYKAIHQAVHDGLNEMGVETDFYVPKQAKQGMSGLCFIEPSENDLMWDKKKVLGGALRVTGWGRLYQGNLLTAPLGLETEPVIEAMSKSFEKIFRKKPTLLK